MKPLCYQVSGKQKIIIFFFKKVNDVFFAEEQVKELIHVSHPKQLTRGNFNSNEAIPLEFHQSCHIQLVQVCAKAQQWAGISQAYGIQFRQASPKHLLITWR